MTGCELSDNNQAINWQITKVDDLKIEYEFNKEWFDAERRRPQAHELQ
jgi:hypothetical protein